MRKILIVKTGFSEFLDRGISPTVSLGDVLICTGVLHAFRHDHVTWLVSWQARELLDGNPLIARTLCFSTDSLEALSGEEFDIIVNLEKDIGLCVFLNRIRATHKFGFYFSDKTRTIESRKRATRYLLAGQENHKDISSNALGILFETIGKEWNGTSSFSLHPARRAKIRFDVGFNYEVGTKWPTKAWPMTHWKALESLLADRCTISWQKGHKNLKRYIQWIDSCQVIVTNDSLGQAIGCALGKKVITLYGPTNHLRMSSVPHVEVIPSPLECVHRPCFLPFCKNRKFCMDLISPERVAQAVKDKL